MNAGRCALAILSVIATAAALAADEPAASASAPHRNATSICAPRPFRWQEDCRSGQLAESFVDRLRAIPLDDDGALWLTLGGEYRLRVESLDEPNFGLRGFDDYTAVGHRWFAHADLRSRAGPRLFVQMGAGADHGREPRPRAVDRSAVDVLQSFVDWPLEHRGSTLLLRLGRQELDLRGNRLVSTREAANLRRAFDLAFASFSHGLVSVSAFAGRPVENRGGAFDDRDDRRERFRGAWIEVSATTAARSASTSAFHFRRDRERVLYTDFAGAERRQTWGIRHTRSSAAYDLTLQAAYQSGRAGQKEIRARGVAGDMGVRAPRWPLQPRFGLSFGVASGDRHAGDLHLNTFDVLYPNLGYFTDAPVFYPGNTSDVQPNLTARLSATATMQTGCDFIFRNEGSDAVYDPPGIPLARPAGSASDHAATLCYLKAQWRPSPRVEWTASCVHAAVNSVLRSAGGQQSQYWLAQVALRL